MLYDRLFLTQNRNCTKTMFTYSTFFSGYTSMPAHVMHPYVTPGGWVMLVFEFTQSGRFYVKDKTVLCEINPYWKHLRCSIVLCSFYLFFRYY